MAYVTGPLQIAAGAASEYFAPGNPFGVPLITGGIGQTAGHAAGGSGGMGEMLGLAGGGIGEGFMGMGPFSGMLGGGSTAGEGMRSMLGMGPSSNQQLLNLAAGKYGAGPGGVDPLIAQGAGDLATYEGIPNAPGYAPVPGQAPLPTSVAQAAAPSASDTSWYNTPGAKFALDQGPKLLNSQPQTATPPAFKPPISQAPIAPKGQAPVTSVTPTVTTVPASAGGRTSQDAYRKFLESLTSGGTGVG